MTDNFNSNTAESILDMNPNDLSIFNEPESTSGGGNPNIYKPMPKDSKSEDGIYRSKIKIIINPFNTKESIITKQSYGLVDEDGFFQVDSLLTLNSKECPIFKAWKKLRYSKNPAEVALIEKKDGVTPLFDKRFARWCLVQILEDDNQPELVGQFKFFKLPKCIWEALDAKMNPSTESKKKPIAIMDYIVGRALDLEIKPGPNDPKNPQRVLRETSYTTSEFTEDTYPIFNLDGTPFVTDAEVDTVKNYYRERAKVMKAEDKPAALAKFKETDDYKTTLAIYGRVMDFLKENCPDLVKEMGFQEWTSDQTERVNKWIDNVLHGNIPRPETTTAVPTSAPSNVSTTVTTSPVDDSCTSEEDDDLPF